MKAQELRIGNFISKGQGTVWNVAGILGNTIFSGGFQLPLSEFEPIPLTEEWCVKLGFLADPGEYGFRRDSDYVEVVYYVEYKRVELFQNSELIILRHDIQYVHQLQNLYFCLTGEELTIQ